MKKAGSHWKKFRLKLIQNSNNTLKSQAVSEINSKIQLLSANLVDQIAAGEVIERPGSVVKELIENAVDAGADHISISVEEGGQKLIQVGDNGCGMNSRELELSFRRHATSKINTLKDLNKIVTMGFRGEALPSIASVSEVHAKSAVENEPGYEYKIANGETQFHRPAAREKGTTFQVRNLFYNIPVRKKFLKSADIETRFITQTVRKYALGHPDIGFTYAVNGKQKFNLQPNSLIARIKDIYGKSHENNLLEIEYEKGQYSVSGFVGNLNLVKKRQGEQYLFLNGRAIQDRLLRSAVQTSYKSILSRGEFPFFVLNIKMPIEGVDVNVHPAKLEVRFQDEWRVYHVIKHAVSLALSDILNVIPGLTFYQSGQFPVSKQNPAKSQFFNPPEVKPMPLEKAPHRREEEQKPGSGSNGKFPDHLQNQGVLPEIEEDIPLTGEKFWQLHNKYILTEIKGGLIIIDQHVAHERVLFEQAKTAMTGKGISSQSVLFPQSIKFLPEEYAKFPDIVHYLEKIGFQMREFGENTVLIEGVPPDIVQGGESAVIKEILEFYCENLNVKSEIMDFIAATFSCKAAIKAGDRLDESEMKSLIDKLFNTDQPYYCPHGRPILINLGIQELDTRFERKW